MTNSRATLEERPRTERGILAGGPLADPGDFLTHLIEGHHGEIYSFHYRLCRDVAEAEGRTQTTFLRAIQGIHTFRLGTNLRAWLFRIAADVATDAGSAAERLPRVPLDRVDEPAAPSGHDPAEGEQVRQAIEEGIAALPPNLGMALVLKVFEGLPHREIAQALEVSEEMVRWRLWKARTLLRERLGLYLQREVHREV
ncbi:MAG TPA: RNA polymerase sigma factor [Planctomycetota bacterium]|jgi:RNA polymerase sigma-70 factor (ECF subfamily)|nr:RNA polymerase sigma factor [Planctomycetota bacterium]